MLISIKALRFLAITRKSLQVGPSRTKRMYSWVCVYPYIHTSNGHTYSFHGHVVGTNECVGRINAREDRINLKPMVDGRCHVKCNQVQWSHMSSLSMYTYRYCCCSSIGPRLWSASCPPLLVVTYVALDLCKKVTCKNFLFPEMILEKCTIFQ